MSIITSIDWIDERATDNLAASSGGPDAEFGATEAVIAVKPPQLPGATRLAGHAGAFGEDALAFYTRCEQFAGLVEIRVWHRRAFVATDPQVIDEILRKKNDDFAKPLGLEVVRAAFGNGLLTAEHDVWVHNRRMIQPAFQPKKLEGYAAVAYRIASERFELLPAHSKVDIHHELVVLCMHILMETLFGDSERAGLPLIFELTDAVQDFTLDYSKLGFPPLPTLMPTVSNLRFRRAVRAVDRWLNALILERRNARDTSHGLLALMMNARDAQGVGLSDRQLRDEMVTMFLAGHETVAAALSWTIELLAEHNHVQARLIEVIDEQTQSGRPPWGDHIPLLAAVIDEGLRLYPPVYRVGRRALRTCDIAGYAIPKGANVLIPQWAVQRSPRHFPDPLAFRPERWTAEFRAALPRFAYFPFGGGPRVCPGAGFSAREMGMVVSALLERVTVSPVGAPQRAPFQGLTLTPRDGSLELFVKPRAVRPLRRSQVSVPPTSHSGSPSRAT